MNGVLEAVEVGRDEERVGPGIGEGRPDLPDVVDELPPPGQVDGGPGVVPRSCRARGTARFSKTAQVS